MMCIHLIAPPGLQAIKLFAGFVQELGQKEGRNHCDRNQQQWNDEHHDCFGFESILHL
jgi:hypothetical protein